MKLWIDDERLPPDAYWIHEWTVAGGLEFLLRNQNRIEEVSIDHDFGLNQPTGYDLIYCLGRLKSGITLPQIIRVHSQNPEGKKATEMLLERLELMP